MTVQPSGPTDTAPAEAPESAADGPDAPGGDYPDPSAFEDGDSIDSAAIVEDPDDYQPPAEPDAEPADTPDDDEPGEDV
jgi:hypothetical protein